MTPRNILLLAALLTLSMGVARADGGSWLVVEDSDTQTCYRMTALPDGKNWVKLAELNTFREAGMWTWEHRDICKSSPVFG
jgi:hypothetical protein